MLYAPTWRDDRTEMVDYVDLASFAGELGDDHVLLVRGHSRTLRYGQDLEADRLIDVTSYPSMADLLLLADVLVTDYSSAMFDFAGTGKPIVFFTPDLAHYSTDLRGFYFDLLAEAPGPVVARSRRPARRDPRRGCRGSRIRRPARRLARALHPARRRSAPGERVVQRDARGGLARVSPAGVQLSVRDVSTAVAGAADEAAMNPVPQLRCMIASTAMKRSRSASEPELRDRGDDQQQPGRASGPR